MKIKLKAARVNAGYTRDEASVLLGICSKTLYSWEKGLTVPSTKYIEKIEDVYQLSYDNIIFFKI